MTDAAMTQDPKQRAELIYYPLTTPSQTKPTVSERLRMQLL